MLSQGLIRELSRGRWTQPSHFDGNWTQASPGAHGAWEANKRHVAKHSSHRITIHPDPATACIPNNPSGSQKKTKNRLSRIGRKSDKTPASVGNKGLDQSSSLPSEPAIVVEDERGGDTRVDEEGDPQLNVSRSILRLPAEREPEGAMATPTDARATRRIYLRTHPQVRRGSTREGEGVDRKREKHAVPSVSHAGG